MTRVLAAELVKIFTVKLWWGLLIPVGVIAALAGFADAAIAGIPEIVAQAGGTAPALALTLPLSMKQTTIFAVLLGLIGAAGEFRHKTITTAYLTAPSRTSVLAAKAIAYGALGFGYGVVTALLCSVGALLSSGTDSFPSAAEWLTITAAGTTAVIMWAVLGVGIGSLISSQVAGVVLVLVYLLLVENLVSLILRLPQLGWEEIPPYLPGPAAIALQTDYAITAFVRHFSGGPFGLRQVVEAIIGTAGQLSWVAGGALFLGYTALALAGGWLVSRRRDIS
jgi:ABC-2 type transport system permease protein